MVGTVAFVVPVTISFMDKIGMIVKVEGASMQVYMCKLWKQCTLKLGHQQGLTGKMCNDG